MKFKNVISLCNKSKTVILYNQTLINGKTEQYIGNADVAYPIYNMPTLTEQNIYALFDIPESKKKEWLIKVEDITNRDLFNDFFKKEEEIEKNDFTFYMISDELTALYTFDKKEVFFIKTEALKPLQDISIINFYLRRKLDGNYIAVKSGMELKAIISTQDLPHHLQATFTIIGNYLNLHNNKPIGNEAQNNQLAMEETIKVNAETGEVETVH